VPRRQTIVAVTFDESTIGRGSRLAEHERRIAAVDLAKDNHFAPVGGLDGPYHLCLSVVEHRLVFDVRSPDGEALSKFTLPLRPLRSLLRDYRLICDNYVQAIKTQPVSKIEAIDMGRRALHNEGAESLRERLRANACIDDGTARRLFSLIFALVSRD
jgi:uncharacterized protein (UPF0262 family)